MSWSNHLRSGLRLSVNECGHGKPLVFQHGLCGDAAQPAQVFPEDIGWRCLTLECRGHGRSEAGPADGFSIATFSDDLADFIESREIDRPTVGGISMGAAIAMRLAVTRPDLVGAIVLARPAWLSDANPPNMAPNALVGELLRDLPVNEALDRFEESATAKDLRTSGPGNLASLRGFFARNPVETTAELLCRISADGPGVTEQEIRALSVPTLVIGNDNDRVHPLAFTETLADWIPNARLAHITPKATDADQYCNEFRAALATFLKELE